MNDSDNDTSLNCQDLETNNTADWIQIGYQLFALAIGTPLNLLVLYRLIGALQLQYSRALSLYLLLNISNLLILLVHCTGYTIWMMQFWWFGGELLCKLYTFLNTFVFHLSSNSLVAIALDLYGSVRFPMQTRRNGRSRVTIFIGMSVAAALISSIPQLLLWGLEVANCLDYQYSRTQCVFLVTSRTYANLYSVIHTVLMFWLPLVIITPAYVSVSLEVVRHYRGTGANTSALEEKEADRILTLKSSKCWKFAKERIFSHYPPAIVGRRSLRRSYADPQRIREKRNRVLKSSLTIVTVYLVSWMPYQISSILQVVNADATILPYLECLEALMIFDTIINPFLYRFIDKKPRNSQSPVLQATRPTPSGPQSSTDPQIRQALTFISNDTPSLKTKLITSNPNSRLSYAKRVSFV